MSAAQIDALLLRRDQEAKAAERERAQRLLEDLNTTCDKFDEPDANCVGLDQFLDLRNRGHQPAHHGPLPGLFFVSLNLTAAQYQPLVEALGSVAEDAEEGLARICREWLADRKRGAA